MLSIEIKQLVLKQWRIALLCTASLAISACTGGTKSSSSSEIASSSEVVISSSSAVVESSSSEVSSVVESSSSSVMVEPSSSSSEMPSSSSVQSSSEASSSSAPSSSSVESSSSESSSSVSTGDITRPGYSVEVIESCTENTYASDGLVLMGGNNKTLATGGFQKNFFDSTDSAYSGLALGQGSPLYQVTQIQPQSDSSCDNTQTWTGVLLKKYANWDGQHSNGLQTQGVNRSFGDIQEIIVELKINTLNTQLATAGELEAEYGDNVDDIQQLDRGNAAFAIMLSNNGDVGEGKTVVQGEKYFEITPDQFDQWLRFRFPADQLDYIKYVGYGGSLDSYAANADETINKVFFNPETRGSRDEPLNYGWVVRNFDQAAFGSGNDPMEIIKEMAISIKKFEIVYSDGDMSSAATSSSVASSSSSGGVSEEERVARIAAGKMLYDTTSVNCQLCHGTNGDGVGAAILQRPINNLSDSPSDFEALVNILKNGQGSMPACDATEDADCATKLADYIWAEFNGYDLPVVGGS